jgi:hypothetical protein
VWQRLRSKRIIPLRERLSEQAALWREQAKALPTGYARQELLRKARQTDVTAHLDEWLRSPVFSRQSNLQRQKSLNRVGASSV